MTYHFAYVQLPSGKYLRLNDSGLIGYTDAPSPIPLYDAEMLAYKYKGRVILCDDPCPPVDSKATPQPS